MTEPEPKIYTLAKAELPGIEAALKKRDTRTVVWRGAKWLVFDTNGESHVTLLSSDHKQMARCVPMNQLE